jgi:Fe-S-cluster containining protein
VDDLDPFAKTVSRPAFSFPENLRFECTRCGDCCRGWQILLGPGELERLAALDWSERVDTLVETEIVDDLSSQRGRNILARRPDGACVFLGAENQCQIHEHFGGETKPLVCRLFPFGFLPVGDRIAVDVSFACRSISAGVGAPVRSRVPEWSKLVFEVAGEQRQRLYRFSKKYEVEGELLWELEHELLGLVCDSSMSMFERVRAVAEFMRLGTTSDPRTDAARTLRRVMAKGIPQQIRERPAEGGMDKTQRAIFFHLMFLLLNPTPPELYQSLGKPGKGAKARRKQVALRVQAANGYKFEKSRPWIGNRELTESYASVSAVRLGFLLSDSGDRLFEQYLSAKILGQRFLREGEGDLPFIEAVPRLLVLYPMLLWTAKALATERGASDVIEDDARDALRLLDRSYGEVRLSELPAKQRKAWQFIFMETGLETAATIDMLGSAC